MQVAIHSKSCSQDTTSLLAKVIHTLAKYKVRLFVSQPLYTALQNSDIQFPTIQRLTEETDCAHFQLMISLGGDGTLLEAVRYVGATAIPILGINTGRMGFLATVARENALVVLDTFFQGKHTLDQRTLLQLEIRVNAHMETYFSLNEVAFLKQDSSSMLTIHAIINGELGTTYWADGLIIATPTGSTGYSLSCQGPIVLPTARNLIVTPISPHNLSVRPLVVPDSAVMSFTVTSRNQQFLVACDGRSHAVNTDVNLIVRKAPFHTYLVKVDQQSIFDVLRQKLHWGLDVRN